jgi:triacylglycerol lipase
MSFLVELPREEYPDDALAGFTSTSDFTLDNARALMWMSQLAYETDHEDKVDDILRSWRLGNRACIGNPADRHISLRTACAVVAAGHGATIVAFAGTDPLKINDWITDFRTLPAPSGIHAGFEDAVTGVWERIRLIIRARSAAERALIFTGHSLGGALAIVAAERAQRELQAPSIAAYTFGSPRPGDARFADAYVPALGAVTYRLVHGTDLVPTVPPAFNGLFRHVGRRLQCGSGDRFSRQMPLSPPDDDKPDFVESLFDSARGELEALLAGRLFQPVGAGLVGRFVGTLPRQIRDHVPASYRVALSA